MSGKTAIVEWCGWHRYLLPRIAGRHGFQVPVDPFSSLPEARFEELCETSETVCFHINLSDRSPLPLKVRELSARFSARGIRVVNGSFDCISKSALQAHLMMIGLPSLKATPTGPPGEILFVKTELNYGGEMEKTLPPDLRNRMVRPAAVCREMHALSYKAAARKDLAPSIWSDPSLTVERYIDNAEGSIFRAYFCGSQVIVVKAHDRSLIKKMCGDVRDINYAGSLDQVRAGTDRLPLSARLKRDIARFLDHTPVDFGCIDIVHDGEDNHYIIDLNPTPYARDGAPNEDINSFLRLGLTHGRTIRAPVESPLAPAHPLLGGETGTTGMDADLPPPR